MGHPNYLEVNRNLWNAKTPVHIESDFYQNNRFKAGQTSLQSIELGLLDQDLSGKKILHLQCHFGQDTISLARMGAEVTGIDLSDEAIKTAQKLSEELDVSARFICSDVFKLDEVLDEQFDMVFTSYGVIGWLPELKTWGRIINHFLKPGGTFFFVEFHPIIWNFDDKNEKLLYPYFNIEPFYEVTEGTYADISAPIKNESYSWAHSIGDVFEGLLEQQLEIIHYKEYDFSPYNCFYTEVTETLEGYQLKGLEQKVPMTFSLMAKKKEV
ncbi:MAG: class I SAM-dependent methyltransferase [Bacteroidota bacterium]